MSFKILSMLVTLGILSVLPLIYMGKFDPMAFFESGFDPGGFSQSGIKPLNKLTNVVTDEKVQVYKWRDKNGVVQFSNTPPSSESNAERIVLDPSSNVVQAVKVPVKKEVPAHKPAATAKASSPYSIKGMKKTIDGAKGVEKLLQQRDAEQQKLLDNI